MHDTLCVVAKVLESRSLVAGGGAVEAALAVYLDGFATTLGSKEQLAIKEFADALLVIPKTLAVNAAQDATELVAKLCAFHHAAQSAPPGGDAHGSGGDGAASGDASSRADLRFMGLDLVNGKVGARVCGGGGAGRARADSALHMMPILILHLLAPAASAAWRVRTTLSTLLMLSSRATHEHATRRVCRFSYSLTPNPHPPPILPRLSTTSRAASWSPRCPRSSPCASPQRRP